MSLSFITPSTSHPQENLSNLNAVNSTCSICLLPIPCLFHLSPHQQSVSSLSAFCPALLTNQYTVASSKLDHCLSLLKFSMAFPQSSENKTMSTSPMLIKIHKYFAWLLPPLQPHFCVPSVSITKTMTLLTYFQIPTHACPPSKMSFLSFWRKETPFSLHSIMSSTTTPCPLLHSAALTLMLGCPLQVYRAIILPVVQAQIHTINFHFLF